jgi:hypothetical protein
MKWSVAAGGDSGNSGTSGDKCDKWCHNSSATIQKKAKP